MRRAGVNVAIVGHMTEEPEPQEMPAAASVPNATVPLGSWRAPVFWMACGALLVSLAGGAVMLAQRIGIERDMAAVAALASPPPPPPSSVATSPPVDAVAPAANAMVPTPPPAEPAAVVAAMPPPPGVSARPVSKSRAAASPAWKQGKVKRAEAGSKKTGKARAYRRKADSEKSLYWEVFKRCPLPGEPGAVECRRHICNGAEGKGRACKAYRGKWR